MVPPCSGKSGHHLSTVRSGGSGPQGVAGRRRRGAQPGCGGRKRNKRRKK